MAGVNAFSTTYPCDSYIPKAKAVAESDPWVVVILIFFFLWVLSVCCYNWRYARTGVPPFPVPNFCPESCYPREKPHL